MARKDLPPEPMTVRDAMSGSLAKYWYAGMIKEVNSMVSQDTWQETVRPPNQKVIKGRWVFQYRFDNDHFLVEFKSRWVIKGYSQTQGVDYDETYAPVARIQSMRLLICVAVIGHLMLRQLDIKTAFLNSPMETICYMEMPDGFEKKNEDGEILVCLLLKALYGLHEAARLWYKNYRDTQKKIGWNRCNSDPCLCWIYDKKSGTRAISGMHVDDSIQASKSTSLLDSLSKELNAKYQLRVTKEVKYILSIAVENTSDGIWISQQAYAEDILRGIGLWDNTATKLTPMMETWKHDDTTPKLSKEKSTLYRSYLMKLAHLANQTRPDLSNIVSILAQHQVDPYESDLKGLERAYRYLGGTYNLGLHYSRKDIITTREDQDSLRIPDPKKFLICYADASHGGTEANSRRSQAGYVFLINGTAVTWSSTKIRTIQATSSTDSELYSLHNAVKDAKWCKELLTELGLHGPESLIIYQDNLSTISAAENPIHRGRLRHIAILQQSICDAIEAKEVKLEWCPTNDMVADIMTKPLRPELFVKHRNSLGLCTLSAARREGTN